MSSFSSFLSLNTKKSISSLCFLIPAHYMKIWIKIYDGCLYFFYFIINDLLNLIVIELFLYKLLIFSFFLNAFYFIYFFILFYLFLYLSYSIFSSFNTINIFFLSFVKKKTLLTVAKWRSITHDSSYKLTYSNFR